MDLDAFFGSRVLLSAAGSPWRGSGLEIPHNSASLASAPAPAQQRLTPPVTAQCEPRPSRRGTPRAALHSATAPTATIMTGAWAA